MMWPTGKKAPGGAGTHTGHTGHTGARGQTDHTDEPHNHPPKPKDTNPHENRDRYSKSVHTDAERTGKKTPGGAGTHMGHTGHTGARAGTRITRTNLTTIHPNSTTHHPGTWN